MKHKYLEDNIKNAKSKIINCSTDWELSYWTGVMAGLMTSDNAISKPHNEKKITLSFLKNMIPVLNKKSKDTIQYSKEINDMKRNVEELIKYIDVEF